MTQDGDKMEWRIYMLNLSEHDTQRGVESLLMQGADFVALLALVNEIINPHKILLMRMSENNYGVMVRFDDRDTPTVVEKFTLLPDAFRFAWGWYEKRHNPHP